MSRIGNRKLIIPSGVTITEENGNVTVKGPKGELSIKLADNIKVSVEENTLELTKLRDDIRTNELHGTMNALINNMMIGVTEGYKKDLEAVGVGYRFALKGNTIVITAGYSHPVEIAVPQGLTVEVPSNTELSIKGISKELVGEFAANIRKVRPPEPYKGKGIRYKDEHVRRKEGKKAA